jgi:hypothetical protein
LSRKSGKGLIITTAFFIFRPSHNHDSIGNIEITLINLSQDFRHSRESPLPKIMNWQQQQLGSNSRAAAADGDEIVEMVILFPIALIKFFMGRK